MIYFQCYARFVVLSMISYNRLFFELQQMLVYMYRTFGMFCA